MPDTKITALTALTTADPATDMFPIVDVSDTTMAASGTTKRISINNILACSPAATLASLNVTGSSIPANGLYLPTANTLEFAANSLAQYRIAPLGVFSWYDGAGGTRMTLNSTGLGVGVSPSYKIHASQLVCASDPTQNGSAGRIYGAFLNAVGEPGLDLRRWDGGGGNNHGTTFIQTNLVGDTLFYNGLQASNTRATSLKMTLDASGNVGVGVTPSAWSAFKGLQVGFTSLAGYSGADSVVGSNVFFDGTNFKYIGSFAASSYRQVNGAHQWNIAASGTAGNNVTFTQAMSLSTTGDLLVGTTTNTNNSRVFVRNGNAANPTLALQGITGDVGQAGLLVGKFDNDSTTSQILVRFTINNNAGGSGQINANGASQAAFGSYSDSRLKENIVSLPSQLANILSLRPVEFDYKDGSGHQIGFVAQEMQEVYSDAVGEQNGFLTVTGWSKTEARLVSAIKELAAKVQALEAKLA